MELYLIRHPHVQIDAGICYGQTDVELGNSIIDLGFFQRYLPEKCDVIFTSPLQRCSAIAYQLNGSKIIIDHRLQELNFGIWEMKQWNQVPREQLDAWAANIEQFKIPGGESVHELYERVVEFLKTLIAHDAMKTVVVVTHAGVIKCLIAHACNLSLHEMLQVRIDYGSISKILVDDGFIEIEYINKTMQA